MNRQQVFESVRRDIPASSRRLARGAAIVPFALLATALACGGGRTTPPTPIPVQAQPEPEPTPVTPPPAPPRVVVSIADSVFTLTNRERSRADLTPLRRSVELTRAAQIQAEQMATTRKLAHDLPGTRYPTLASRLKVVGYSAVASGENVAEGYTSGAALLAGWMTSTAHRANILSARYTETGVGTARSKAGRTYHVQVFGRRRVSTTDPRR